MINFMIKFLTEYLTTILVTLLTANALTGYAEDCQKLLALQFDGYEDMTVSDFQDCVWELTDTAEYRDLLERVSGSEALYELKDDDKTAAFLFYVLEPLTAEKWQSRDYSGYAASQFPYPADNAALEYVFTLTIWDADTLTIREYNEARLSVMSGMQDIISAKTKEELQDTNTRTALAALQTDTDNLIRQLQTEKIGISIEYAYFPLSAQNGNYDNYNNYNKGTEKLQGSDEDETRRCSNGTEEDYRSLLTLKTPDYQSMPLADFNNALLEWTNENPEIMERISEDTGWDDFQANLTAEELSFVKLTVFLSGMENGKAIQSIYAGTVVNPYYDEELQKTASENGAAWCSLYYQFSYSISDTETITVSERDRQIEGMINAVHAFWNDTDIESMLKMSERDIVEELEQTAAAYSGGNITITTDEGKVHFECMDERNLTVN